MAATATPPAHAPAPPVQHAPGLATYAGQVRVTGQLQADAVLRTSMGARPRMHLVFTLQPAHGLPYLASVDLGEDLADHMGAEALLPLMRTGAVLSVAAQSMELRTDHGHAALRLVQPHSVLILQAAAPATPCND